MAIPPPPRPALPTVLSVVTHGRHSPGQAYLYQKIDSISRQRADEMLRIASLSSDEMAALERAKDKLENTRIVVNLNLHERFAGRRMLESLFDSGRIYNLFEIAQAAIGYNPSILRLRIMLEFKLYGGTQDIQDVLAGMSNTEHPNYGLLDYLARPIGYSLVGFYGWYRCVLKKKVRDRSTFSPMDTKYTSADQTFVWRDIDGVLATKIAGRYWFEYINDGTIPLSALGSPSYIETQILGGAFLLDDVDRLYFPETDRYNRPFFRKLVELASRYKIRLGSY